MESSGSSKLPWALLNCWQGSSETEHAVSQVVALLSGRMFSLLHVLGISDLKLAVFSSQLSNSLSGLEEWVRWVRQIRSCLLPSTKWFTRCMEFEWELCEKSGRGVEREERINGSGNGLVNIEGESWSWLCESMIHLAWYGPKMQTLYISW